VTIPRPETRRQSGALFGLVVGMFIAALLGDLVFPRHQPVVSTAGSRAAEQTGPGAVAGGGAGEATTVAARTPDATGVPAAAAGATGGPTAAGGAGSSAAAAGGGSRAATTAVAGARPPATTAAGSSRGVSASVIKIGVAYADLTALRALGPEYDNGNVPQQWMALLDQWHRQGALPVNGRDVQLVFRSYNVVNLADQRAACASLIQDSGVFAVVGVAYFAVGSECVAREFHTPMLTSDGPGADVFRLGWPYLFSIDESSDRTLENMLYWAHSRGALRNKKIGVYYANDGLQPQLLDRSLRPTLKRLGYKITNESTTSANDTNGGPEDAIAVQRFRSAGVDLAILLTSKTGFLQAANAQAYRPTFIDSDFLYGTSDVTTSTYPAPEWTGTYALTATHRGEAAAGTKLNAAQEACLQNYERYSGTKLGRPGSGGHETAAFAYVLTACDEGNILLDAMRGAGRGLTARSLVSNLEAVHDRQLLRYSAVTFSPTRHDGVDSARTLLWRSQCTCYVAQGAFAPLTVR
jgi:hypothetical protein